jgi:hypothetical protein
VSQLERLWDKMRMSPRTAPCRLIMAYSFLNNCLPFHDCRRLSKKGVLSSIFRAGHVSVTKLTADQVALAIKLYTEEHGIEAAYAVRTILARQSQCAAQPQPLTVRLPQLAEPACPPC